MGFIGNIATGILVAYASYSIYLFYHLIYPERCVPRPGTRRPWIACLRSELEFDDYAKLQLRIYTSQSVSSRTLRSQILHVDNFSMQEYMKQIVEVPLPAKTRKNGSLWLHAFVLPQVNESNPFKAPWHLLQTAKMTVYRVRKRDRVLIYSSDESSEQNTTMEERPVSHWRSKVTLRGVGEPFPFVSRKVPPEMQHLMVYSERDRYYPLFYLDWLGFRTDDLVEITANSSKVNLTLMYTPTSVGHLHFLLNMRLSLRQLKAWGFKQSDIDEILNMMADLDIQLLLLTLIISMVHAVLDFLAFRNDVDFWRRKTDMQGLSRRTIIWRLFSEIVIFFNLLDKRASLLVVVPVGISALIELWKLTKIFKVSFKRKGLLPRMELGLATSDESKSDQLDSEGMHYMNYVMVPLVIIGAGYSLLFVPHTSWYSWLLQSMANGVYAFGFLFMMPQLFINYRLKSVAHMPWKTFMYKAFNTFIDDVFAFVFRMPTAHRLACFRDDIIFLVYLYQRWLYPVDKSRVNEFGVSYEPNGRPNDPKTWKKPLKSE
ncbi:cleft lip and palate transmembrane protein [Trichuris trichiura]|uniref:Lipid scramblase CLPTM1L n=1 Tax=Trichuris trichiura TaxID=36087 RepID=A0A077ZH95_TRITR|nr:cleft lip and palate transmembrane protein [Trichuris trichiura]